MESKYSIKNNAARFVTTEMENIEIGSGSNVSVKTYRRIQFNFYCLGVQGNSNDGENEYNGQGW
jgi:hypothetical protein